MSRAIDLISTIVWMITLVATAALAGPVITIYTDSDTYTTGDAIEVSLSAKNLDEAMSVAVYIGLLGPDGVIYTLQFEGWTDGIEPWIPEIWVPRSYNLNRTSFWSFDVPCLMPPIEDEGLYHFMAGLTRSGTFEFVCDISYAPFEVRYGPPTDFYVDAQTGDDSNDGSERAPWGTITHALGAVAGTESDPVTIHVAASAYSASTNGEGFPLEMKSYVSLIGAGSDTTVLDAEGNAFHVIYCDGVASLAIEGFAIMGGSADGPEDPDQCGGGIYCYLSSPVIQNNAIAGNSAKWGAGIISWFSSPTIQGNTIADNTGDHGGGIYCDRSSATIQDNAITGNSAQNGGGIYCLNSSPTVTDCEIRGNTATTQHQFGGGGIFCMSSPITIDSCSISENVAFAGTGVYVAAGGGILLMEMSPPSSHWAAAGGSSDRKDNTSTVVRNCTISDNVCSGAEESGGGGIAVVNIHATIQSCVFSGNSAGSAGGGMAWAQITYYDTKREAGKDTFEGLIRDCVFKENLAALGAGIAIGDASPVIANCLFTANSALWGGGAFAFQAHDAPCSPEAVNCTISGNAAGLWGGGAIYSSGAAAHLENSIVWGDEDDILVHSGEVSISYSCVQAGYEGESNIHDAPMFVSGPFGDYYLHPDSPCIDAGSKSAEDAGLSDRTTQADGTPDTGTVDMGFHFPLPKNYPATRLECERTPSRHAIGPLWPAHLSDARGEKQPNVHYMNFSCENIGGNQAKKGKLAKGGLGGLNRREGGYRVARLVRLERTTYGLEVRCSIQLSYRRS